MSEHSALFTGENVHLCEVLGLADPLGVLQTDATVQLTSITTKAGVAVPGITTPIALPHVGGGDYRATMPTGGQFVAGRIYVATFSAVGSQGFEGEWSESLVAQRRTG